MQDHSCMITNTSNVYCWGREFVRTTWFGKLHHRQDGIHLPLPPQSLFDAGRHAIKVVGGNYHTCALLDNGSVTCWGGGSNGQHGDGAFSDATSPHSYVQLPTGRTVVRIDASYHRTCALLDNHSVYCWGQGGLGTGSTGSSTPFSNVPVSVVNLTSSNVTSIEMGYHSTWYPPPRRHRQMLGRADGALGRTGSLTSGVYYDTPESIAVLPFGRTVTQLSLSGLIMLASGFRTVQSNATEWMMIDNSETISGPTKVITVVGFQRKRMRYNPPRSAN